MPNKQVFWSVRWDIYRRGLVALKQAGFHPVTERGVVPTNKMHIWRALVPPDEFRRAARFVRREF